LKKRQIDNEAEKKREASFVNLRASRIGQALFRDIKKTSVNRCSSLPLNIFHVLVASFSMNQVIRWSNNDILINNTVRIVEPYRTENVSIDPTTQPNNAASLKTSAKGDNDTKTHIMKLVDVHVMKMIDMATRRN
jgi:hypothetical protein